MQAFLHIGTPKTGTTTLQQFLHTNRARLADNDILYPESFGSNSMGLVVASYDQGKRDGLSKLYNIESDQNIADLRTQLLQNTKRELVALRNIKTVIFSSEYFQLNLHTATELESVKSAIEEIGLKNIKVVVYLREQADMANSFFSTAVKAGETAEQPPSPGDNRYRHLCDHKNTLDRFSETFGRSNIIVNVFEKAYMKNASIIDDFMHKIGFDIDLNSFSIPKNKNESLSTEGTIVLSRLNNYFPRWINGALNPLRQNVIDFAEDHYANGKYNMPPELYKDFSTRFKDGNDWIRDNYFPEKTSLFQKKDISPSQSFYNTSLLTDDEIKKYALDVLDRNTNNTEKAPCELSYTGHGICHYHICEYDQAHKYLDLALSINSTNRDALRYKAMSYQKCSQHIEAAELYECLLAQNKTDKIAWMNKAECYQNFKNHKLAQETLLDAQALCTDYFPLFSTYADYPKAFEDWNSAADRWINVCSDFPQATSFQNAASCLKKAQRYDEAVVFLNKLLVISPTVESAWINKARCELQKNNHQLAEQTLLIAQKHCSDCYPLFSEYANIPRQSENWQCAADRWVEVSERFETQTSALRSAAVCLKNAGRHHEAADYFGKLLLLEPDNETAWISKAQCEIQNDDEQRAEQTLLEAQKCCPDCYPLFARYANIPRQSENWQCAADRWIYVCQRFNNQAGAYRTAAISLKNAGRNEEAATFFRKLLLLDPTNEIAWLNKAQCEIQIEEQNNAEQTLLDAQNSCPDYYPLFSEYANLPRREENWKLTATRWKEVCAIFPNKVDAFFSAAIFLVKAGNNEEAILHFEELLNLQPTHQLGILNKATTLITLNRVDEAESLLYQGINLYPEFIRYQIALANLSMSQNRLDEALENWTFLLSNHPNDSQCLFGIAVCFMKLKEYKTAYPYFTKLLAESPNNNVYSDYIKRCGDLLQRTTSTG